ncbi:Aquaporin AQPAe.a [Folsomia candida]|uniref:Aquaporin AQPAe.a n=1 Tax=Folsomia candida TaxID=158441 RepID=A0A226ELS1_FOLCA|nr:Aquaporin AQPAe.a [Folsomia candida]
MGIMSYLRQEWKRLFSEFLGTFLLVFLCVSVGLPWDKDFVGRDINLDISLTNGFTVATLITIFGHTSGCQINPAVTLSMLFFKHIEPKLAVLYILFQCLGSIAAASILLYLTPPEAVGGLGVVQPGLNVAVREAFGTEFVITFILLFVIFAVSDKGRKTEITGSIPLAVGLTVAVCSFVGNNFSGACMNPARSIGPAVVTRFWDHHWIYWVAPITGGLSGASVYHKAFRVFKAEITTGTADKNMHNKLLE